VIQLKHGEAFTVLTKQGVSLESLLVKTDAVGEIKLLQGKDVRVL
jgi:hypothetical protein